MPTSQSCLLHLTTQRNPGLPSPFSMPCRSEGVSTREKTSGRKLHIYFPLSAVTVQGQRTGYIPPSWNSATKSQHHCIISQPTAIFVLCIRSGTSALDRSRLLRQEGEYEALLYLFEEGQSNLPVFTVPFGSIENANLLLLFFFF